MNIKKKIKEIISFKKIDKDEALNSIIYGMEATLITYKGDEIKSVFFLNDEYEVQEIKYLSGPNVISKLKLNLINDICIGKERGNFVVLSDEKRKKYNKNLCMTIFQKDQNNVNILFREENDLYLFCQGLKQIWITQQEKTTRYNYVI